jgi:hypothetical protein
MVAGSVLSTPDSAAGVPAGIDSGSKPGAHWRATDNNGPFGIDPDEFDRRRCAKRAKACGARSNRSAASSDSPERAGFGMLFDQFVRPTPKGRPQPETAGEAGDGVWAIYISDADGKAHVEQVYKTELDALRANKLNTDPDPQRAVPAVRHRRQRARRASEKDPENRAAAVTQFG